MTGLAIVCGLAAEAKIASSPGNVVIAAGGSAARIESALDRVAGSLAGIVSFGVAGGLRPGLAAGDILIADAVHAPDGAICNADPLWAAAIFARLSNGGMASTRCAIAGVSAPLAGAAEKAALWKTTGASLVDMESHAAAAWAVRHDVRFAAIRVVADSAERSLPHAATVGMRTDGSVDLPAILRSLLRDPRQVPALIGTGLDARAAFAALLRCRQSLGPSFAFLDL